MIEFGFSDTKDRNIEKKVHVPVKDDVVKYCGAIVKVRNEHRGFNDYGLTCSWEFIRNSHENGPAISG